MRYDTTLGQRDGSGEGKKSTAYTTKTNKKDNEYGQQHSRR